jgi:hypothetical protein
MTILIGAILARCYTDQDIILDNTVKYEKFFMELGSWWFLLDLNKPPTPCQSVALAK